MMGQRIAALDVGDKRIGVAVSDALELTAQPLVVLERVSLVRDVSAVTEMLASRDVACVVVGLPLESDGKEGKQSARARQFGDALAAASGLQVVYQDERMTTLQSERILVESGMRRERRRSVIDKMAAALILQSYLDARSRS